MLVVEYKRNFQLDPVLGDIAVFVDLHILILDPGGFDVPERFHGSCNSLTKGIVKTHGRRCFDFAYAGNRHRILLDLSRKSVENDLPFPISGKIENGRPIPPAGWASSCQWRKTQLESVHCGGKCQQGEPEENQPEGETADDRKTEVPEQTEYTQDNSDPPRDILRGR
jgi:hypothetical protein